MSPDTKRKFKIEKIELERIKNLLFKNDGKCDKSRTSSYVSLAGYDCYIWPHNDIQKVLIELYTPRESGRDVSPRLFSKEYDFGKFSKKNAEELFSVAYVGVV